MNINSVNSQTFNYSQDQGLFQKIVLENIFPRLDLQDILAFNHICKAWKVLPPGSVFGPKMWKLYFGLQLTDIPLPPLKGCDLKDKLVLLIPESIPLTTLTHPLIGSKIPVKDYHGLASRTGKICWLVFSKEVIEKERYHFSDFEKLASARNLHLPTPIESICAHIVHYVVTNKPLNQGTSICSGNYSLPYEDRFYGDSTSVPHYAITKFSHISDNKLVIDLYAHLRGVGLMSVSRIPADLRPKMRFYKSLAGHRIYEMPASANSKSVSFFIDTGIKQNQNKVLMDIATGKLKTLCNVTMEQYEADQSTSFNEDYPVRASTHRGVYISEPGNDKYYLITDYAKTVAEIKSLDDQQKWDLARDIIEAVLHIQDRFRGQFSIQPENIHILETNPMQAQLVNCLRHRRPIDNQHHFQLGRFLFGLFVDDSLDQCDFVSSEFYSEKKQTLHKPIERLILELFNLDHIELSFFQERFMHLYITRNRPTYALTESERAEVLLPRPILAKCKRAMKAFTADVNKLASHSMTRERVADGICYLFKKDVSLIAVFDTELKIGKGSYKRVKKAFDLETGAIKALAISDTEEKIDLDATDAPLALPEWSNSSFETYYTVTNAFECRDLFYMITWCDFFMQSADKLSITRDMIDGLQYLHHRNLIHSDLKTSNIFVHFDEQGKLRAKIGDFGFLTPSDKPSENGNLSCMSPEKMLGDLSFPESSDTYGLGVMLFELFIHPDKMYNLSSACFPNYPDKTETAIKKFAKECLTICKRNYDHPLHALIVKIMHPYRADRMSLDDFDREFTKLNSLS